MDLSLKEIVYLPDFISGTDLESDDDSVYLPRDRAEELAFRYVDE